MPAAKHKAPRKRPPGKKKIVAKFKGITTAKQLNMLWRGLKVDYSVAVPARHLAEDFLTFLYHCYRARYKEELQGVKHAKYILDDDDI